MKLIGSVASPYARRIRMLLEGQQDYEFETLNVFSEEGQKAISEHSPTRRVPILIDGDKTIWDSFLITKYLYPSTDLEQDKVLVLINEANDSAINLFQLKFFGMDSEGTSEFSKIQTRRIETILSYFEEKIPSEEVQKVWLFCLLDWLDFRTVLDWRDKNPKLSQLVDQMKTSEAAQKTDPRH
jgi:glutathione S-transferase